MASHSSSAFFSLSYISGNLYVYLGLQSGRITETEDLHLYAVLTVCCAMGWLALTLLRKLPPNPESTSSLAYDEPFRSVLASLLRLLVTKEFAMYVPFLLFTGQCIIHDAIEFTLTHHNAQA